MRLILMWVKFEEKKEDCLRNHGGKVECFDLNFTVYWLPVSLFLLILSDCICYHTRLL